IQEKHYLFEKALGDERTKDLENLGKKFWKLQKRIDHLQGELPSGRDGVHPLSSNRSAPLSDHGRGLLRVDC
ncbi:MAG: hypothetical protein WBL63_11565, partial [Candidatus Acidiferrum sp.]